MVLRRQAHDVRDWIVVVGLRDLDGNVLEPCQVEQMAGKLAAGPGRSGLSVACCRITRRTHHWGPNTRPNSRAAPSARRIGIPGM